MTSFDTMATTFPLMRGGGVLLVLVGLGLVVGGIGGRRWLLPGLITGATLAVVAMTVGGITKLIFDGLGYPRLVHYIAFGIGIVVEVGLVNLVVAKIKDKESREFWLWILFVVGVHFLVLTFSHGPICGALGLVCMINALIGLRLKTVSYRVFWVIDGVLKVAAGTAMVAVSY